MIVGIDLGTTHSLIGCHDATGPRLFANALGEFLTPSVVSMDASGQVVVGQPARDRMVSHPQASVANFKRWMGSPRETRLGAHSFRPEELSALILRSLIADAEAALGERIDEAVISVPAYFSDAQRKATRAAGELAGIRVERLINEPTAAALAYGLREKADGARFLVFDLGGGTFDVSVLEMFEGVVEVHASAGDNFLGGEDFLDLLEQACRADLKLADSALDASQRGQLRRRLEAAKRDLGSRGQAQVELSLGDRQLAWQIDEDRFARLADPLVQRMRAPLERAMRDARLKPEQLDEIVLVGGASRMPLVARTVSRMFGRLPLRHVNPDRAIALGACIAAGLKSRDQQLEEVILTDVCPYSLGTEVARRDERGRVVTGFFEPIIQRNNSVPVSREETFWPIHERQRQLQLDVYQGESPLVEKNIKLGALTVDIDPALPIAQNAVTVRFTYDINGVLQVEARVHADDRRYELLLEQNPGLLDAQQIRERLAALNDIKIHPRSKQENLAVLARAERLYEEHLLARDQLQEWIARFRAALESQDDALIREHRREFARALDTLESA
ncbi:molecular chaperone HscC [Rhodanobacter denitrificans]|uniref:Molecular chaperone n=1 Tax=Rhodanobacter denitrificans TaxID=666685 RepID=M4NHS8_9GAMM|nr:molecular chaperone HscC [Rhodanobacter denitrificans]AGG89652.1 molecular chaperone [Rhodanobacter denitrificans]UJM85050.1 molecular chaperone HscC [Rhodanobacter denitrificans]